MNRDAKIGIVVILIIVGLLFIIWGRSDEPAEDAAAQAGKDRSLVANSLDQKSAAAGDALDTEEAAPGYRVDEDRGEPPTSPLERKSDKTDRADTSKPAPPKSLTYVVQKEDTLSYIAETKLGDRNRWKEIAELNDIPDPDLIQPGTRLKLPPKDRPAAAVRTPGAVGHVPLAAGQRAYTVKKGDKLALIAGAQLGDKDRWKEIAELNKLADPDTIYEGQVLLLPAK